ncbi:hypothetical protein [Amylibacter sp. IMCC11727]|uniref:hypothetical protein n=1 Tax=Amylibacter sp. IMCC11727 TaxID=3039851 RepID=UPI00244DD86B|nr:hypothetical protein [Amylibacter sp. IMCC11727]WGI21099.1 hypothetical protein QBD29_13415 [Amylibacter sp. IMCC11727]
MAGIGHNGGPKRLGRGWQKHCWTQSRNALIGKRMPVEVVRMRIKRARELGLEYPQYASILLGSGRDIVGFLFSVDGLQLRLRKRLEMPDLVQDKLRGLDRVTLTAFAPSGETPKRFQRELSEVAGVPFASCAPEAEGPLGWSAARAAVRAVLDPLSLPSDAVVMIGTRAEEARMAEAAHLARFIASGDYFGNHAQNFA